MGKGYFHVQKDKGFTLIELMGVLLVLSIIMSIGMPLVTKTMKNAYIKKIKTDMVLVAHEIEQFILDNETFVQSCYLGAIQAYQSPYIEDDKRINGLANKLHAEVTDLPAYFAYQIESSTDYIEITVSYPGYNEVNEEVKLFHNIGVQDLAGSFWPLSGEQVKWADVDCEWTAKNNINTSYPNGGSANITSVSVCIKVYDINQQHNHSNVSYVIR